MPKEGYYLPSRGLIEQSGAQLIEPPRIERSKFTGRKTRLTTFDAGTLIPIHWDEVYPGDHMTYDLTAYIRQSTPLFPNFSNQRFETFGFFVPYRILWTHWVNMMGEQANPADSIAYLTPTVGLAVRLAANSCDIWDYLGVPNQNVGGNNYTITAWAPRAYNKIWNAWFRDENMQNSVTEATGDTDSNANYALLKVGKLHDYFTSALPWPQKFTNTGAPLTGFAPVAGIGFDVIAGTASNVTLYDAAHPTGTNINPWVDASAGHVKIAGFPSGTYQNTPNISAVMDPTFAGTVATWVGPNPNFTINAFRQALMIQGLLERQARGGTRYVETIKSQWGVISPDFRLQRPEYIGGGQTPIMTTPVAQTAPSTGVTVGALGAAATAAGKHHFTYAATEHGLIMILGAVRTELAYQQGIRREYIRSTEYDYYNPLFAHLGEQDIRTREIYADGTGGNDNTVFGYQERFHELRMMTSDVTGAFRSTNTTPIDGWHMAEKFATAPSLGNTFIQDPGASVTQRAIAAGAAAAGQQYLADILIQRVAVRPMPAYGTPALLGRF